MSTADLNLTHLTTLLEKLNKEDELFFLMGDLNIELVKMDSKCDKAQFYYTIYIYKREMLRFKITRQQM